MKNILACRRRGAACIQRRAGCAPAGKGAPNFRHLAAAPVEHRPPMPRRQQPVQRSCPTIARTKRAFAINSQDNDLAVIDLSEPECPDPD